MNRLKGNYYSLALVAMLILMSPSLLFATPPDVTEKEYEPRHSLAFKTAETGPEFQPGSAHRRVSASSTEFLISSPLNQSQAPTPAIPETPITANNPSIQHPSDIMATAMPPDTVAMLVSETCKQVGGSDSGPLICQRAYSNGHSARIVTERATMGDEYKQQSVIEEFDRGNQLLYKKTIRHRIDYNYYKEDRGKERELIDIVYEPAGKKATRELIIHQYHLDSGKTKSMTWAQYKQIETSSNAGLVYHASLVYNQEGSPDRGVAEKWDHGKKIASYLDWNSLRGGPLTFSRNSWREWESWIQNVTLQAYLP